jgi:hypothetical protein
MSPYSVVWEIFAWSITVAVLWPVMFPWLVLAYKIWHGRTPIEEEMAEELWTRSAIASFALTITAVAFLFADYAIVEFVGFPAGVIHLVFFVGFLSLAAGIMYYCFYMEDFFQGMSLAIIYLYIPALVLFLIWLAIRNIAFIKYGLFSYVQSWLADPALP